LVALGSCLPCALAGVDENIRSLAHAEGQQAPLVRIGLTAGHRIEVSSGSAMRVVDPATGEPVWKPAFEDELVFVAEGGPKGTVPKIYRVQVGAFSSREAAQSELERLQKAVGVEGVVRHDPDRGNWRVRMGSAERRLTLNPLMDRLRGVGLEALWIAEEPREDLSGVRLRLVDASYESLATDLTRLVVLTASGSEISVDGERYRGIVELRVTAFGTVRPINWINLETYLLGVVPAELGPEVWPQLEALKAQAVAARTYVWRNKGQFSGEGYDLCATPRCQVYDGASAEHPLSNRAVWSTRGEILTWRDEPIVALYTATCGGHTEDGAEIFPEERNKPYLTGVPCRAENDAMSSLRATVQGAEVSPITDETGHDVARDWFLLQAAGVIDGASAGIASASDPIDAATLRGWTTGLARVAGLPEPVGEPHAVDTLARAAEAIVDDLGWTERARVLLATEDLPALLRDPESVSLPDEQRRALAYLVLTEAIKPASDGRLGVGRVISRARAASALARVGESYKAFRLRRAVVSGMGERSIRMIQGKGEIRLPFVARPWLFGLTAGQSVPVTELEIWPGDRVQFRTNPGSAVDFLELRPPVKGTSDDRSAAVYSWETRKSRRELEASINRRLSIGRLKDLQIVRRGVSGRVVELRVVGTTGSTVVRGFDIRRLLDIREILAVIELQRDEQGEIKAAVFAGKGWGHGVGMCQVGAYGMALRGADYREILGHYYQGSSLSQLDAGAP
jgi:stage II sporulation protein D